MIPKSIHTAFVGAKPSDEIKALIEEGRQMNVKSGWKFTFHGDELLDRYKDDPFVRRLNGMCVKTAFIMDRLRLLLLRDEGGWWFDSDCKWVRPASGLNRLCDNDKWDFVTAIRNPWRPHIHAVRGVALVDNTVFGTVKNGRTVNRMLSLYTAQEPKQTGLLMGANLLATCDEQVAFLNFRYFYMDDANHSPETIVLHDDRNLYSWREEGVPEPQKLAIR